MTVCHRTADSTANGAELNNDARENNVRVKIAPQIILSPVTDCEDYGGEQMYKTARSSCSSFHDTNGSVTTTTTYESASSMDSVERRHPQLRDKRSLYNQFLPLPIKGRTRHVSFEEDPYSLTVRSEKVADFGHPHQSSILKPGRSTSTGGNGELVRNEYSDSPIFVRKHQVEDFRCNGVRMSITSLCESVDATSRHSTQRHLSSLSSLGSYTCLPAITLTTSQETKEELHNHHVTENKMSNAAKLRALPMNSQRRRRMCSDRRMSAFEVLVQEMAKRKESCQQRFCQIYVLLVILQISLGLAISTMAIYLPLTTSSIQYRDATIWSGIPLAVTGVVGLCYHMIYTDRLKCRTTKAAIHRVIFIVMSLLSAVLCTAGCITSGIHGTKIANYQYPCIEDGHLCVCFLEPSDNQYTTERLPLPQERDMTRVAIMEFSSCKSKYGCCDLVFTNIKDCLLLECAFNCIGVCISVWLIALQWKNRPTDNQSTSRTYSLSQY